MTDSDDTPFAEMMADYNKAIAEAVKRQSEEMREAMKRVTPIAPPEPLTDLPRRATPQTTIRLPMTDDTTDSDECPGCAGLGNYCIEHGDTRTDDTAADDSIEECDDPACLCHEATEDDEVVGYVGEVHEDGRVTVDADPMADEPTATTPWDDDQTAAGETEVPGPPWDDSEAEQAESDTETHCESCLTDGPCAYHGGDESHPWDRYGAHTDDPSSGGRRDPDDGGRYAFATEDAVPLHGASVTFGASPEDPMVNWDHPDHECPECDSTTIAKTMDVTYDGEQARLELTLDCGACDFEETVLA